MRIGIVGLGRMGSNIARRLLRAGHETVVFDHNEGAVEEVAADGAVGASSLDELVDRLPAPRTVWVMLPAGEPTEETIGRLSLRLDAGDTIIDGGNSFYKDDIRRAAELQALGVDYIDVGTSGGIWGAERGYCMMIGARPARSTGSIRSSMHWHRDMARSTVRRDAPAPNMTGAPRKAIFMLGLRAPGIS